MATSSSQPNQFIEILLTIILPTIALDQLSQIAWIGPFWALIISLIFPIGFGGYCFVTRQGLNLFSILGFVTILLSGGLGLLNLNAFYFAIKESVLSLVFALAFPLSHWSRKPLIQSLLLQPKLINMKALNAAIDTEHKRSRFEKLLFRCSCGLALGIVASAIGNFFLALYLLEGKEPGSEAFVRGIGKLTWMGMLVLGIPLMGVMLAVLRYLIRGMEQLTHLEANDLLNPGRTVRRQVQRKSD